MDAFVQAAPQSLLYPIHDLNGNAYQLELKEQQFTDATWINDTFAMVQLTDELDPVPPYPRLIFAGGPGRIESAPSGPFDEADIAQWRYRIDAVVMAESSEPQSAQRLALMMLMAFDRVIERNQQLGGLVQLIAPESPITPGGAGKTQTGAIVGGAMVRYGAVVLVVRP